MINFKEISQANLPNGNQDDFELFARDFFETYGYRVIDFPARGSDGGKDLIIKEVRKGVSGIDTEVNWLVSCKHFAHSGKSVSSKVELNINDRVKAHNCQGFIGFYSTLPSEGLASNLKNIQAQIYDRKKIESIILSNANFKNIFRRYFPISYKKWELINMSYNPSKLFEYYLKNEFKDEIDFFIELFFNLNNLFTALISTNSFDKFIEHSGKKIIVQNNIWKEIDNIYQNEENKNLVLTNMFKRVQTYLSNYLSNKGMPDEKLMIIRFFDNIKSILILSNKSIITSDSGIDGLKELYQKLKQTL